jgi:hypothetical protein
MFGSVSLVLRAAVRLLSVACLAVAVAGCTASVAPSVPATMTATRPATTAASATGAGAATPSGSAAAWRTAHPAPSASASASASATATGSGGTGAGSGTLAGCSTGDLRAKAGAAQGAAGSLYQIIDFTNVSGTACTLYGYPGVALAAGNPVQQVGAGASRSTVASATVVTLEAGQTANTLLRITQAGNYPAGTCKPKATAYLQIYPPNQTAPMYLQYASTGCASVQVSLLSIGVVQAGAGSAS